MTGKFKKIAVIQNGAVEHLLHSLPAVLGLKRKHPNASITLYSDKSYAALTNTWTIIDRILHIDTEELKRRSAAEPDRSLAEIFDSCDLKSNQKYDLIVNLSFNDFSTLLASHLSAPKILGPYLNENNEVTLSSEWAMFFAANVDKSILNPFHFVDLYKYIAEVQDQDIVAELLPTEEHLEAVDSFLSNNDGLRIGLELKSLWPIQYNLELALTFLKKYKKCRIYLIGSMNERPVAKSILSNIPNKLRSRCVDLSGQANINELLALTERLHLMIGAGGISTHFSAAVGTLTVTLDYINQNMFQSSPYGHGHIIIGDDNQDSEHIAVPPSTVANIIEFIIESNDTKAPTIEQWQQAFTNKTLSIDPQFKVFVSQRQVFHQFNGVERVDYVLEPVNTNNANLQESLISIYRLIWQFDLNHSEDTMTEVMLFKKQTIDALPNLVSSLEKLYKLAKFGSNYSKFVLEDLHKSDIEQAKLDSDRLQEIDNLIHTLAQEIAAVAPICNFYHTSQAQIHDTDPIIVAEKANFAYNRIKLHVNLVLDLVQEIIAKNNVGQSLEINQDSEITSD